MSNYQQSFEAHEKPVYYYKLNENYTGALPASVEGFTLHKEWKGFERQNPKFNLYLRTYKNPRGTIDLKVEDMNKKVYSDTEMDFNKKRLLHSREVLVTFKRKVLEDIARQWNIDPINKRDPFLIDLISDVQEDYKRYQETEKSSTEEEN
jgi:hypothetical protein